ncbi:hypothetical protein EYF80_011283 [Liparis tanakae]|uniref:Uncharacterized protein n=1 Tax=Liparis tanakae TaxID=230148 RepID=A0A4Z2IKE9_9TELE|nr:hypothetical protein EYF80_011283 [Liparis tanakae]
MPGSDITFLVVFHHQSAKASNLLKYVAVASLNRTASGDGHENSKRIDLAAACQGCRGSNGDGDIHPSARVFLLFTQNRQRKRPRDDVVFVAAETSIDAERKVISIDRIVRLLNDRSP